MASNLKYSNGTRNAQQQGLITYAGSNAIISLYTGTQPANANTALSSNTLLAALTMVSGFGTDSNGTLTLGTVSPNTAVAAGTATFFRITKSDGTTVVMDGSVGTSGADLNLNTTTIALNDTVAITSGTIIRNN